MAEQVKPFRKDPCSGCPALIVWAITERGKLAPYDAEPSPDGTAMLSWSADGKRVHSRITRIRERAGRTDLYRTHFATCPSAAGFSTSRIGVQRGPAGQALLWEDGDPE